MFSLRQNLYSYNLSVICSLAFFLVLSLIIFGYTDVAAQQKSQTQEAVTEVRTLFPSEWGVPRPVGIAYATELGHIYLLDHSSVVSPTNQSSTVVTITPYEDHIGDIEIPFTLNDAINIAFDDVGGRLFLFDSARAELAEIRIDANGLLDATTLQVFNLSHLGLQRAAGIAVDAAGEELYILDKATSQVVRVALASAPIFDRFLRIELSDFTQSALHGLAIHPQTGQLVIYDSDQQQLLELTPNGQLTTVHDLSSLQLISPNGMVFIPSSDLTDPTTVTHLLLTDSMLPGINPSVADASAIHDEQSVVLNHIYLPLITAPTLEGIDDELESSGVDQVEIQAGLLGRVIEISLCSSDCGTLVHTLTAQVARRYDDAEEKVLTGSMHKLYSTDLEMAFEAKSEQLVGIRFRKLSIPPGATIVDARIEFTTDEVHPMPTNLFIRGELAKYAAPFTLAPHNISSRQLTDNVVNWFDIPIWTTINQKHKTPNLAPLVQEIVNSELWHNERPMVFVINGTGRRTADSYDGSPQRAPKLTVDYLMP